jgi:hypothetical protein
MKFIRALRRQRHNDSLTEVRLNRQLDELPILSPAADFTERVMSELTAQIESGWQRNLPERLPQSVRWRQASRAELTNGLVATAATYFFVASGMLGKLVTLDVEQLSLRLTYTVTEAVWISHGAVNELSQWLHRVL